jgi:hypothetical protein
VLGQWRRDISAIGEANFRRKPSGLSDFVSEARNLFSNLQLGFAIVIVAVCCFCDLSSLPFVAVAVLHSAVYRYHKLSAYISKL